MISDLPGLVFTIVWGLDLAEDLATIESYVDAVNGQVSFVELWSDQVVRLERNATAERLEHKRSKRDLPTSRQRLLDMDAKHVVNTGGGRTLAEDLLEQHRWVRIDNTHLSPADAAAQVVAELF